MWEFFGILLKPIMHLLRKGDAAGTVVDLKGNPVSGVEVIFDDKHKDITDRNGEFIVQNVKGKYSICLLFDDIFYRDQKRVLLQAGQFKDDIDLILPLDGVTSSDLTSSSPEQTVIEIEDELTTKDWWKNHNPKTSNAFLSVLNKFQEWLNENEISLRVNWSAKSYVGFWHENRCLMAVWPQKLGAAVYLPNPSDDGDKDQPSAFFQRQSPILQSLKHRVSWAYSYNAGANPIRVVVRPSSFEHFQIRNLFLTSISPYLDLVEDITEDEPSEVEDSSEHELSTSSTSNIYDENWWRHQNSKASKAFLATVDNLISWLELHNINLEINWSAKSYVGFWSDSRCLIAAWPQKRGACLYIPDVSRDGSRDSTSSYFDDKYDLITTTGHKLSWNYTYNRGANPIRLVVTPNSLELPEISTLLTEVIVDNQASEVTESGSSSTGDSNSANVLSTDDKEQAHFSKVNQEVYEIYCKIKEICTAIDPTLSFNPQKYYISIRSTKNICYLSTQKRRIRMVAILPESEIREIVSSYPVSSLSESVKKFYSGECAVVMVNSLEHIDEIQKLLTKVVQSN